MLYLRCFLLLCLLSGPLAHAQSPVPAPAQKGGILVMGATAHLGNGQVIANSAIGFEAGRLTLVADATTIRIDRTKYAKIFDASGKHVYPGLIALDTRLGLTVATITATHSVASSSQTAPGAMDEK